MLLEKGIKDTRRSVSRQTALFAARSRDKVIFRLLLEKELNPDVMSETFGLVLYHTVCYGWMEGARVLLDGGPTSMPWIGLGILYFAM